MNIAVRLPNWLGDIVMSSGFLKKLNAIFIGDRVDVIVKHELAGFAELLGDIDTVHQYRIEDLSRFNAPCGFGRRIAAFKDYDIFFCLPDSFSSALMGFCTGSRHRLGYRGQFRSFFFTRPYSKPSGLHRAQEYAYLLHEFTGDPCRELDVSIDVEKLDSVVYLSSEKKNVVFNINSVSSSRRLPFETAVSLAAALSSGLNCRLILTGTDRDAVYTRAVTDRSEGDILDMTGRTDPASLAALLYKSDLVVTVDSGLAHLANAAGTGTVVIFGAGNEASTAPYRKENLRVVRAPDIECAPCVSNRCRRKDMRCLRDIEPESVLNAALELLGD